MRMKFREIIFFISIIGLYSFDSYSAADNEGANVNAEEGTNTSTLLGEMATMAGVPAESAQRVSGAFVRMVQEVDDSSFIDTLGLTKMDALQMFGSVAFVGFNCRAMHQANSAIEKLSTIGDLGEKLGEACKNNGAEWAASEQVTEFARGHSKDPSKIAELVKAGKLEGAADPIDWCRMQTDPLFDAVNKPVRLLGINHIDDNSRREIGSMLESSGDAYARQIDFDSTTSRQIAMSQQLDEASRAAGFQVATANSGASAPYKTNKEDLEKVICGVQDTARISVFRVFLLGQATVSFVQFNQLLNTRKSLRDAQVSIDGVEELIETISNDFRTLRDRFNEINLLDMDEDPDPQTQNRLLRTINVLQAHIQALDTVLGKKITELEVLRNHVLEPKGRASVHGAIFNFASAAATFYTTGSMQMKGVDKWFGYGMTCAQAGLGIGNTVAACQAYDQIKTVNGRLATLRSVHEMFNLILERVRVHNELGE
ncbi:MAG: hypothetical protein AB8G05_27390 [Oligoflexales bacterium]